MRKILENKLWEKKCDWRNDQHTDPTTYLAIVQPYGVGIYLLVRTRYGGMSVRPISDAEKYRIIAEYEKDHDYEDPKNCDCEGCKEEEMNLEYENSQFLREHLCGLNHEARRDCGQAISIEGQGCCNLKKGCASYPEKYGEPVYDEDE